MARAVRNGKPASDTSSRVTEPRMSRARGPHSAKQTRPEVRSFRSTLAIGRQVAAQPGQVVLPERGAR